MPRAPSEKVTQAEKLFNDGMAMVEIAKKLEVSDGTVRSWKNRYGWGKASKKNKCNVAKKNEKKNATLQKKKRGGQPKNQNAKGGSGNPNPNPPPDRTKHGGYVPVFMDALDSDEQELLESIPEDTELARCIVVRSQQVDEQVSFALRHPQMDEDLYLYGWQRKALVCRS